MAATCLSSIYFGQKRKDVFTRLARILRSEEECECGYVKGSVYPSVALSPASGPLAQAA